MLRFENKSPSEDDFYMISETDPKSKVKRVRVLTKEIDKDLIADIEIGDIPLDPRFIDRFI